MANKFGLGRGLADLQASRGTIPDISLLKEISKLFNVDIDVFYTFLDVGIRDINDKIVYSREAYYLAAKYNEKFEASKRLTIKGRRQLKFYRDELRRSMLFAKC